VTPTSKIILPFQNTLSWHTIAHSQRGFNAITQKFQFADITDGLNVAFGANNLFDEYPDVTAETPALDGTFSRIFPFSGFSPFGFSGRYVYGRIRYSW